jgi:hypothetical protein
MATQTIRTFLIYAEEDYKFRDQLTSQAKGARLTVDFADMPTKQPWVERWKATVRTRAYECDGAIILISKKTKQAAGVKWELECVHNAGLPLLGVYAEQVEKSSLPEGLEDARLIQWNWNEIADFIKSLGQQSSQTARR